MCDSEDDFMPPSKKPRRVSRLVNPSRVKSERCSKLRVKNKSNVQPKLEVMSPLLRTFLDDSQKKFCRNLQRPLFGSVDKKLSAQKFEQNRLNGCVNVLERERSPVLRGPSSPDKKNLGFFSPNGLVCENGNATKESSLEGLQNDSVPEGEKEDCDDVIESVGNQPCTLENGASLDLMTTQDELKSIVTDSDVLVINSAGEMRVPKEMTEGNCSEVSNNLMQISACRNQEEGDVEIKINLKSPVKVDYINLQATSDGTGLTASWNLTPRKTYPASRAEELNTRYSSRGIQQLPITMYFKPKGNEGEKKISPVAPKSDVKKQWQTIFKRTRKGDNENPRTSSFQEQTNKSTKSYCPKYKKIPGMPFAVDAFNYGAIPGVEVYFLSHFHSDHYIGLSKNWSLPVYCSQATANLAKMKLGVLPERLHVMRVGEALRVCNVEVIALDANHCPGSLMFFFKPTKGETVLHVGDFRNDYSLDTSYVSETHVDWLFLDTTYCDPCYDFPSQKQVVAFAKQLAWQHVREDSKTLIVCGSYTIGKERLFIEIAKALECAVWVTAEKKRVLNCLGDEELNGLLVKDPYKAKIHVLQMQQLQHKTLSRYLAKFKFHFSSLLVLKPTGWEFKKMSGKNLSCIKPSRVGTVTIYPLPYSEHSSFSELQRFVHLVKPKYIESTVPAYSSNGKKAMQALFKKWLESL